MNIPFEKSRELQARAQKILPLGVNSNFRYWGDGITPYVKKGSGSYLWDVDGNRYIDYRMAFGPIILGHAHPTVDAKVTEEIQNGVLFAMTGELEIEVAEMIAAMCPGVDMVRMACSGTEATMHAVRVARAYTARDRIIKFEGMYHGFQDHTLVSTYAPSEAYGSQRSPIPVPASSGIPRQVHDLVTTLPFNNFDVLDKTLRSVGWQTAAIIVEPCMGNCAAILPAEGFLDFIRQKCDEYGIVFILDEVKTGFRIAKGGAQEYYNLKPDLATYAKALGNGYPVAAFGGKREIMSIIGHGVSQGGTYTNNKPGIAAAWATLKIMQAEPVIETITARGKRLMEGLSTLFDETGITYCMNGYPAMFTFAIGRESISNQREWNETDKAYYLTLTEKMIERGVMPDHDPREPWFLCYAHSEEDINTTLSVARDAIKAAG